MSDLPSWDQAKRVSIDLETYDPTLTTLGPGVRRDAYIVGVSFAIEDGPAHYVPLKHHGGDNVENPVKALDYFRDQAKSYQGTICGANLQYDLDFLAEQRIVYRSAKWFRDCQIAEPLLDELQMKYSLEAIAQRRGIPGKDETMLQDAAKDWGIDPKKGLWQLPARFVAAYAVQDAVLPLQLLRKQEREIDEQNLWRVYDLESQLLPVLVKMRRRGVRISFDKLDEVEAWAIKEETSCLEQVFYTTGVRIGVGDTMQPVGLAAALKTVGFIAPTTPQTGQPSIDAAFLDSIDHPVAKLLKRARKVGSLRTKFVSSIRKHAVNGRIHTTFNQLRKTDDGDVDRGARFGRVSSTDPNLQQQPARDDFADLWRSIYLPDEGGLWASDDYSQQEPRLTVHYAYLSGCTDAVLAKDAYCNDPNTDNHTMTARLVFGYGPEDKPTYKHRRQAKDIFLGLCYGMGGAKLARFLDLPTKMIRNKYGKMITIAGDEAQVILDQFNQAVPFVKELARKCENKAKHVGVIKTILGRRCRFPVNATGTGYDWCHKALNRLIQGSAADQTKLAMVQADEAGFKIQLQVHDEIAQTVENREQAEALAAIMKTCVNLTVPSKVDVEIGPSWGEAA